MRPWPFVNRAIGRDISADVSRLRSPGPQKKPGLVCEATSMLRKRRPSARLLIGQFVNAHEQEAGDGQRPVSHLLVRRRKLVLATFPRVRISSIFGFRPVGMYPALSSASMYSVNALPSSAPVLSTATCIRILRHMISDAVKEPEPAEFTASFQATSTSGGRCSTAACSRAAGSKHHG